MVEFDLYVPGRSWLHRLDPRVKLLIPLGVSLLLFLHFTPLVVASVVVGLHLVLWRAGVPWRRLAWVWWMMLPLFIMVPLAWFLFQPVGRVFWSWGIFRLSWGGLWHGFWVVMRLLALALAAFLWLFTTDPALFVRTFVGLKMPYMLALTVALALRYLPTIAGLYIQVHDAQRARGLDLDQGPIWQRLRVRIPILIAVIIGTLRLAQYLGWALETRALGATLPPGHRRTVWRPLRLRREDKVVLGILVIVIMIILGW
ncbi:MAG: energy-coupling factor transporter transmembrane protein EcfT [Chloroflexi bacterium]|nr:energy-coupling factor transporter transmembrane protein EcfT [Chloroflexota bacterium]